jgi:hypothetical protein
MDQGRIRVLLVRPWSISIFRNQRYRWPLFVFDTLSDERIECFNTPRLPFRSQESLTLPFQASLQSPVPDPLIITTLLGHCFLVLPQINVVGIVVGVFNVVAGYFPREMRLRFVPRTKTNCLVRKPQRMPNDGSALSQ